jgi:transposase
VNSAFFWLKEGIEPRAPAISMRRATVSPRKLARKSRVLTAADRLRIVLESFEDRALVSVVARRNGVDARELSRWRRSYRAGQLLGADPDLRTVPVSELAGAAQRIRDLERELGRMALENSMLLEAVEFAGLPASRRARAAAVKRRKK